MVIGLPQPQRRLPLCEEQHAALNNTKAAVLVSGRPGYEERADQPSAVVVLAVPGGLS